MDGGSRPSDSFLSTSEWLDHAEGASTRFMAASGGGLPGGGGNDGPGVCLGDGQTEAYLTDMGMADLASAWPDEGWSTVARWTRRRAAPAYAPIPDLT